LILIEVDEENPALENLVYFATDSFPSDAVEATKVSTIVKRGLSTDRNYLYVMSPHNKMRVVPNTASGLSGFASDKEWSQYRADVSKMAISVWPGLEYRQMYNDAWRMLRDYFYDENMHGVDWAEIHSRYKSLVQRCSKREELDDVLGQMISELSVLHAYVYGGEFNSPDEPALQPASLGVGLKRVSEWKGYMVTEIPEHDPDFNLVDGGAVYCPLSDQTLRPTGQKGLQVGDVIVGVNGESALQGPDINMLLRGLAGRSVRLEVLRLQSGTSTQNMTAKQSIPEPVIVVPITTAAAGSLLYNAWEWKSRQKAKELATEAGFTVGYVHMQAMDRNGEDAFARGFYPDYDKDALILDVRHNDGGNIDSWVLSVLQRKAWSYWGGRGVEHRNGDMDWDEQFAFRGKVVVLIDEYTASNGEGVFRGISELGLEKIGNITH
jgi:tricorn protease